MTIEDRQRAQSGCAATGPAETRRQAADGHEPSEPIAILGIGCRFPGGINSPDDLWQLYPREVTRSRSFLPTGAGIWMRCSDPTPTHRGRHTSAQGGSWTMWVISTRRSSGSVHVKPKPWTHSSDCCSRRPGRRWSEQGLTRVHCTAVIQACSSAQAFRSTARASARRRKDLPAIWQRAPLLASRRVEWPTH